MCSLSTSSVFLPDSFQLSCCSRYDLMFSKQPGCQNFNLTFIFCWIFFSSFGLPLISKKKHLKYFSLLVWPGERHFKQAEPVVNYNLFIIHETTILLTRSHRGTGEGSAGLFLVCIKTHDTVFHSGNSPSLLLLT